MTDPVTPVVAARPAGTYRTKDAMHTRRFLLAGATSLLVSTPAWAAGRRRHPAAAAPAAAEPAIPSSPANSLIGPIDTIARWACIVDYTTGAVLLEKAADERMPPSSLTKMMTAYVVFGMLRAGRLTLEQTLPVSEKAWRMQGSKMFVPLNGSVAVSDLIQGMVIQSGNDACIVLAEGVAGSEDQFVSMMNAQAAQLGMTNSHFLNATGWPMDGHYMSARDVATIAMHLIHDFPEYYHFFSERSFTFNKIAQENRNALVVRGVADGLKTGHTDAGGFGLCASAERGGNRVVMAINGLPSSNARANEGERLFEWSFVNFENATLIRNGAVVDNAPVWLGQAPTVPLVATRDVTLTLPHGWQNRVHVSVDYRSPVPAPVTAGQTLGEMVIANTGLAEIRIPLVAGAAVPRLGLMGRASAVLGRKLGHG
ncbi:D-alanyl-D-alanine carboxypeptidase family protein [Komagataeibacter swingsii]|uniref:serine-type D-Ala-D-Ala carboxypeptidase n=1 Tax=Komagataeibacter swingsii TaxID=215220 RepID=A0A850P2X0_9PROT|nr:D-alanyl-D-alanine carboxypeptidase family protein [Komagataeibacter swingsii]NVN37149.1 D-alanyl-D-alanine carboxypeptidase [Komagataeibacter swingsii]RFP02575.1 D-alanyl-D-alanine carboxypeptidase [Komagataeibacter xylinus]RFP04597.1 D-alanyl-D-alanine carboxypeptidase [Komagataeibacter xylinus]